jgi:hypothetical protein
MENIKMYLKHDLDHRHHSNECPDSSSSSSSISTSQKIYLSMADQTNLTAAITYLGEVEGYAEDSLKAAKELIKEVKKAFCLIYEHLNYLYFCPTLLKDHINGEEIQIIKNNSTNQTISIFFNLFIS